MNYKTNKYENNGYRTQSSEDVIPKPELKLWQKGINLDEQKKIFKDFWAENKYNSKISAWESIESTFSDYEFKIKSNRDFLYIYSVNTREIPAEVQSIITAIEELLRLPHQTLILKNTVAFFLREDGDKFALLMQQRFFNPSIAKARKRFIDVLGKIPDISSFFSVNVRPSADFQLKGGSTQGKTECMTLKGTNYLCHKIQISDTENIKMFLHPLDRAFPSQFQAQFHQRLIKAINPSKGDSLLHLYSSSAHSSALLAPSFDKTICCDIRKICGESIFKTKKTNPDFNLKFINTKITSTWLSSFLDKNQDPKLTIMLSPPTGEVLNSAIISTIASHQNGRVLRVYPDAYSLKEELKKWKRNDFLIRKCIPISYDSCTSPIVIVLFAPDRDGILKLKKRKVIKKQETPSIKFVQK